MFSVKNISFVFFVLWKYNVLQLLDYCTVPFIIMTLKMTDISQETSLSGRREVMEPVEENMVLIQFIQI